MQEGKRIIKGATFHVCHWCKNIKGFWGKRNARFCCVACRSANCKLRAKLLVDTLESFFVQIGFSVAELRDFRERFLAAVVRVAELLGYRWNEWEREWVK